MLQDKVKVLEKLRDKLERRQKKELKEREKFFEGQLDVLSKIQVENEQRAVIQEQIEAIETQKQQEMQDIIRNSEIKINSVYAQINLLTEFISEGFDLIKK